MNEKHQQNFQGSGWAFPVSFSAGNHQLNVSSREQNINECIDIILQTRQGERCMEPTFGSGLQRFFFRKMDESLKAELGEAIRVSLLHNEPRITVREVSVVFANVASGLLEITVSYVYNQTNTRHNYVFPFHLTEGTNLS